MPGRGRSRASRARARASGAVNRAAGRLDRYRARWASESRLGEGAAIIIATMKPPVRIAHHRRRLLGTLLLTLFVTPAFAADEQACRVPVTTDPRLEELLKADPDDPHIDISSDSGDLARSGDAELSGNVTDPHGTAAAHRRRSEGQCGEAQHPGKRPHRVPRPDGARHRRRRLVRGRQRRIQGREVRAGGRIRARRGEERAIARRDRARPRGRALHGLSARQRRLATQGRQHLARPEEQHRHRTQRAARLPWRPDPLHAMDLLPGRGHAQVGPAVSRDRQRRQDGHADRRAVVLEHRTELRRDVHFALFLVTGLSHRPRIPLPDGAQPRHARGRVPAVRQRTQGRPRPVRVPGHHSLRAAHAGAGERLVRHGQLVLRGLRRRLRRHQHHLPEPARGTAPRHDSLVARGTGAELPGHRRRACGRRASVLAAAAGVRGRSLERPAARPRRNLRFRGDEFLPRPRAAGHPRRHAAGAFVAHRATRGVRGRQCGVALHDVLTRRNGARRGREPVALASGHEPRHRLRARADDGIEAAATADAGAAPAVRLHPVSQPGRDPDLRHGYADPEHGPAVPHEPLRRRRPGRRRKPRQRRAHQPPARRGRRPPVPERDARPGVLLRGPAGDPAGRGPDESRFIGRGGRTRARRVQELERAGGLRVGPGREPDPAGRGGACSTGWPATAC